MYRWPAYDTFLSQTQKPRGGIPESQSLRWGPFQGDLPPRTTARRSERIQADKVEVDVGTGAVTATGISGSILLSVSRLGLIFSPHSLSQYNPGGALNTWDPVSSFTGCPACLLTKLAGTGLCNKNRIKRVPFPTSLLAAALRKIPQQLMSVFIPTDDPTRLVSFVFPMYR